MSYKLQIPEVDLGCLYDGAGSREELENITYLEEEFGYKYSELIMMYNQFRDLGYIVVDLVDIDCEKIIKEISNKIERGDFVAQNPGYQYSNSPRIFEAWRDCKNVLELARHRKILAILKFIYHRDPIPFQTINFKIGSNQPLHSDVIHFTSEPPGWTVGAWTALEKMDKDNGTLRFIPTSHKLPYIYLQQIGLDNVDPELPKAELDKKQIEVYRGYEEFIRDLSSNFCEEIFIANPGQTLLWAANLIHGGAKIKDESRTRWSQATHYFFKGCNRYYSPLFSNPFNGKYADKDLSKKDIPNHRVRR